MVGVYFAKGIYFLMIHHVDLETCTLKNEIAYVEVVSVHPCLRF